jgi:hypothetical protein
MGAFDEPMSSFGGSGEDSINLEKLQADGGPDYINYGIYGAHLVKVNFVDSTAVHLGFCFSQRPEDRNRPLFNSLRQLTSVYYLRDVGKPSVLVVRNALLSAMMAVFVPIRVGMSVVMILRMQVFMVLCMIMMMRMGMTAIMAVMALGQNDIELDAFYTHLDLSGNLQAIM